MKATITTGGRCRAVSTRCQRMARCATSRSLKNSRSTSIFSRTTSASSSSFFNDALLLALLLLPLVSMGGEAGKRRFFEEAETSSEGWSELLFREILFELLKLFKKARMSDTKGTTERYRPAVCELFKKRNMQISYIKRKFSVPTA